MRNINYIQDRTFLQKLDAVKIKVYYVKIFILDALEKPIKAIDGRVTGGSISINGNSSVRRTGSINFIASENENDLTDLKHDLSINKRIKILIGLENNIDDNYDKIIWFNQGIFIITNPSLSHSINGIDISLQFSDKMCLLNGQVAGTLPTSVILHEYSQMIGKDDNGGRCYSLTSLPININTYTAYLFNDGKYKMWNLQKGFYEVDAEQVINQYVDIEQRIFDIILTLVANYGGEPIENIIINDVPLIIKQTSYYSGSGTLVYNNQTNTYTEYVNTNLNKAPYTYTFGEECGYKYIDYVYGKELVSSIGDSVSSMLDKIISEFLMNHEYFYDINGHFIFQEKRNHLNTQYEPIQKMDEHGFILDTSNWYLDFAHTSSSVYTFEENNSLINSYNNTIDFLNIKNDYHIWGENTFGLSIHYHLVIKEKPLEPFTTRKIVKVGNEGRIRLANNNESGIDYTPTDWRAELYLQGLEKIAIQQRPDIYQQEILDLFDDIYNMADKTYKVDIVNNPNALKYFIDYINPTALSNISVDAIGSKIYVEKPSKKIVKLYSKEPADVIIINKNLDSYTKTKIKELCDRDGNIICEVDEVIDNNIIPVIFGYSAEEFARNALYQHTDFNSSISINTIPIYYLEPNTVISVYDKTIGIKGEYIMNSINLPLDAKNTMSISASQIKIRV